MEMENTLIIGILLFSLGAVILSIASMWTIFNKAGKPGWAAIIPIYNMVILLEVVGKPVWWIILMLIPFVNLVIIVIVYHNLSLSFGKDVGFTIGLVMLNFIFLPLLAFGDSKYLGPVGEQNNYI